LELESAVPFGKTLIKTGTLKQKGAEDRAVIRVYGSGALL
jgi:hypothetical protein